VAEISQYSIVTYERRPGHWRAAITPIRRSGTFIQGKTISSFVTPDDSVSESDAKFAAEKIMMHPNIGRDLSCVSLIMSATLCAVNF
jgi:hypothetical protein